MPKRAAAAADAHDDDEGDAKAAKSTGTERHFRSTKRGPGQKVPWSDEETQALLEGVERWQVGKWSAIKDDPDFGPFLAQRTTVDMKDKFRNLLAKRQRDMKETAAPSAAPALKLRAPAPPSRTSKTPPPPPNKSASRLNPKRASAADAGAQSDLSGNKQLITIYDGRPRARKGKEVAVQILCSARVRCCFGMRRACAFLTRRARFAQVISLIELAAKEFGCEGPVSSLSLVSTLAGKINPASLVSSIPKFDRLRLEQDEDLC